MAGSKAERLLVHRESSSVGSRDGSCRGDGFTLYRHQRFGFCSGERDGVMRDKAVLPLCEDLSELRWG